MEQNRVEQLDRLAQASPLDITRQLESFELYDKKSSQAIIDEVYAEFASGGNLVEQVVNPVILSIVDGMLEATAGGRAARKKGLTASRVLQECEQFSYDGPRRNGTTIDGYAEYKNAREHDSVNSNFTQQYERDNYEDKRAMREYKEGKLLGEKTLKDEYTGKQNLYLLRKDPNLRHPDETYRRQAQPDHIVPLKQIHDQFKGNYALDDDDIRRIANMDSNLAVTSAAINQTKKERSNKAYIQYMDDQGKPVDETTRDRMLAMQTAAEKAVNREANKTVLGNLTGRGEGDKGKTKEIYATSAGNATKQASDYAVGNLILFLLKPLYYEIKDMFKHGMKGGVGATSTLDALKTRFGRVKAYVVANAGAFLGDNMMDFVKGFVSSLVEGIISLFVGMFKQVLKLIKEGIKIFVNSAKILFGKDAKAMSPAERGDAIIKLLGGSVIAIAGIGIEALLNKIGIGEPWSIILSTMLAGIASALFMFLLDKADLFSVKAEKRRDRIEEIFEERIRDIRDVSGSFEVSAADALRRQYHSFEASQARVRQGFASRNMDEVNAGLYKLAELFKVELPYRNTDEFVQYVQSRPKLEL